MAARWGISAQSRDPGCPERQRLRDTPHRLTQDNPLFLALCRLTRPHYQLNPGTNWPGAPENVTMDSNVNPTSIEMGIQKLKSRAPG